MSSGQSASTAGARAAGGQDPAQRKIELEQKKAEEDLKKALDGKI